MSREQLPTSDDGRDGRGRFAAGNRAGRGNPHHRRVAELRAALLNRVTTEDMAAVVEALVSKAKTGDIAAIKLLFDRVLGRVPDCDLAAAGEHAEIRAVQRVTSWVAAEESAETILGRRASRETEEQRRPSCGGTPEHATQAS